MSTNQWQPNTITEIPINQEKLEQFIDFELNNFIGQVSEDDKNIIQYWIKAQQESWLKPTKEFSDDQLLQLIQFFTLAEKLPNCDAGANSCVIALVKIYKQRGKKLERDFLQWIKANTDNKFLPNGPL